MENEYLFGMLKATGSVRWYMCQESFCQSSFWIDLAEVIFSHSLLLLLYSPGFFTMTCVHVFFLSFQLPTLTIQFRIG